MVKRFTVWLDQAKVERLKDKARHQAVRLRKGVTWVDLLREAADVLLATDAATAKSNTNSRLHVGGAR